MIEHELSGIYDVAHGAGLAVIFPAWMKHVYKNDVNRFARFAVPRVGRGAAVRLAGAHGPGRHRQDEDLLPRHRASHEPPGAGRQGRPDGRDGEEGDGDGAPGQLRQARRQDDVVSIYRLGAVGNEHGA